MANVNIMTVTTPQFKQELLYRWGLHYKWCKQQEFEKGKARYFEGMMKAGMDKALAEQKTKEHFEAIQSFQGAYMSSRRPSCIMVMSNPGVGKTSIIRETCEELKIGFRHINCQTSDSHAILGIPMPDKSDTMVEHLMTGELPITEANLRTMGKENLIETLANGEDKRRTKHYKELDWERYKDVPNNIDVPYGILLMDEFLSADVNLQGFLRDLALERKLFDYQLPDGWLVVCAGNGVGMGGAREDDTAPPIMIQTGFKQMLLKPTIEDFIQYSETHGVDQSIIDFMEFKKNSREANVDDHILQNYAKGSKTVSGHATPRTWELFSNELQGQASKEITEEALVNATDISELNLDTQLALYSFAQESAPILEEVVRADGSVTHTISVMEMGEFFLLREDTTDPKEKLRYDKYFAQIQEAEKNNVQVDVVKQLAEKQRKVYEELSEHIKATGGLYEGTTSAYGQEVSEYISNLAKGYLGEEVGNEYISFVANISKIKKIEFDKILNADLTYSPVDRGDIYSVYGSTKMFAECLRDYGMEKDAEICRAKNKKDELVQAYAQDLVRILCWVRYTDLGDGLEAKTKFEKAVAKTRANSKTLFRIGGAFAYLQKAIKNEVPLLQKKYPQKIKSSDTKEMAEWIVKIAKLGEMFDE